MAIMHAKLEHIDKIRQLAESLRFDPIKPKAGALITVLNPKEYAFRIKHSDYFYVEIERGELVGFLMCLDNKLIARAVKGGMFHHTELLPFLLNCEKPFIYGESIGIRESEQRKGIGKALMDRWIFDMGKAGINKSYVMIRHKPARNNPSIDFVRGFGFRDTGTEVSNRDMIHGIYEREC
jgi:GNAT superfamily N-acetyltransferase